MYFGTDSAISTKINDNIYRLSEDGQKIWIIDNQIIFCSGRMEIVKNIMSKFLNQCSKSINDLKNIAKEYYEDYIINNNIVSETFLLDILIGNIKHKQSIVYQISPYNDFQIIERKILLHNQFGIWTGGIKTRELFNIAHINLVNNKTIQEVYQNTFDFVSYEGIGGNLFIYKLDNKNGCQLYYNNKIKEKDIQYINVDLCKQLIVAEQVYGKLGIFAQVRANQIVVGDQNEHISPELVEIGAGTTFEDGYNPSVANSQISNPYFELDKEMWLTRLGSDEPIEPYGTIVSGVGIHGGKVWESNGFHLRMLWKNFIPIDINNLYQLNYVGRMILDPDLIGLTDVIFGVECYDASYTRLSDSFSHQYLEVLGVWYTFNQVFTNRAGYDGISLATGTVYVRPFFTINYSLSMLAHIVCQTDILEFVDITGIEEHDANESPHNLPSYCKMQADGFKVFDALNNLRCHLGQYQPDKYGLLVKDKTGSNTILDEDGILQTWQEGRADNIANGSPLILNVYLPTETKSVYKAILRFKRLAFRAYSTAATSGGGQTSSSGGSTVVTATKGNTYAVSGDGTTKQLDSLISSGMSIQGSSVSGWIHSAGGHTHSASTDSQGGHNHGISDGTSLAKTGGGSVIWSVLGNHSHNVSVNSNGSHTHSIDNHAHHITHEHDVSIPSHTHTVSDHVHGITYGIYTGTTPIDITVIVNGNTVGTYSVDQDSLDISSHMVINQWNTIQLSAITLGRIDATIFIQAKMGV